MPKATREGLVGGAALELMGSKFRKGRPPPTPRLFKIDISGDGTRGSLWRREKFQFEIQAVIRCGVKSVPSSVPHPQKRGQCAPSGQAASVLRTLSLCDSEATGVLPAQPGDSSHPHHSCQQCPPGDSPTRHSVVPAEGIWVPPSLLHCLPCKHHVPPT